MFAWLLGDPDERERCGGKPRSPHWPAVRRAFLRMHPECAACGRTESLEVHHVVSFATRPDLELIASNLITLCDDGKRTCHRAIGHLWDWSRINPDVREWAAKFRALLAAK